MKRPVLTVAFLSLCAVIAIGAARSEDAGPGLHNAGSFGSQSVRLDVIKSNDDDRFYVGIATSRGPCTGYIAGEATASSVRRMSMSIPADNSKCSIVLDYSKDMRQVEIKESSCLYYHGAACGFEGKVTKKR